MSQQTLTWNTQDLQPVVASQEYNAMSMLDKVDPSIINYELIEDLISHIVPKSRAILVFLSGRSEIRTLMDRLLSNRNLAAQCVVLALHASLSTAEQQLVFQKYPNKTKIIVSTNVAETSLTIDDVTVVVDAGCTIYITHL